jgi:hypothetical protein
MKGVAQTILLLLCWGALQRWLLGIGLVLAVGGLVALTNVWHPDFQPLFAIMVLVGVICVVISPALVGGIVFRSLSAARATGLIPNGRLKLVLGAFKSQLLVALFVGVAIGVLFTSSSLTQSSHLNRTTGQLTAVVFVITYALLSVQFIGYYWFSQFPFGGIWLFGYALWPQLFLATGRHWHLEALFATPAGLEGALAVIVSGWLLFALLYLRTRRIGVPHLDSFLLFSGKRSMSAAPHAAAEHPISVEIPQYSRRNALRTLLLGLPENRPTLTVRVGIWVALLVFFVGLPLRLKGNTGNPLAWVPLMIVTGPIAAAFSISMTQRARTLWLASGLGRAELFAEVERYSWRLMLIVTGISLTLLVPQFVLGVHDLAAAAHFLRNAATPITCAAAFIYAGMAYIRGHRLAGSLIVALCVALWLIDILNLNGAIAAPSLLLGVQIILVPVLRLLSLRQWQDIDWLLNRPKRLPLRLA